MVKGLRLDLRVVSSSPSLGCTLGMESTFKKKSIEKIICAYQTWTAGGK